MIKDLSSILTELIRMTDVTQTNGRRSHFISELRTFGNTDCQGYLPFAQIGKNQITCKLSRERYRCLLGNKTVPRV